MKEKNLAKFLAVIPIVMFVLGLTPAWMPGETLQMKSDGQPNVTLKLEVPSYKITHNEQALNVIWVEGFDLSGQPGTPLLPRKVYNVAIPPQAMLDSLSLKVVDVQVVKLPGTYRLKLASPDLPLEGSKGDVGVHQSSSTPVSNASPGNFIRLLFPGQMRKWRFARLEFTPFLYDVASGELGVVSELTVQINYDSSPIAQDTTLLKDRMMDGVARQLLVNYDAAQSWYQVSSGRNELDDPVYDYVIITTNAIETNSTELANFVAHKQGQGYSVLVVTEDEYNSLTGPPPNGRAEKVRQWLINNYDAYGFKYVLLVGNPTPGGTNVTDLPMKMCWPRHDAASYQEVPTDYFFADLTGNWDLDGDQYFGEWEDDFGVNGESGETGVDLAAEVYVGRIPVYNADYAILDHILQKIVNYEDEAVPAGWRKNALLPMSFLSGDYDGAQLAEQIKDDYLDGAGFSSWTLYQQSNGACGLDSTYTSDEELRGGSVVKARWAANDYGLVVWWGHGPRTPVDQTTVPVGYDGCWDGILFSSHFTYSLALDDDHPSFIYQNSHSNGYPENDHNLQYTLLKQGGIATVGAARVSWFNPNVGYGQFAGSTTNSGIGYEYVRRLVQGQAAGNALYNAKGSMTPEQGNRLMNLYDFNLYGDPSIRMLAVPTAPSNLVATLASPTRIDLWWTDNSNDESGFKIERSLNGTSDWTHIATVGANVITYSDTGLVSDITYYRVYAYNADGDSTYSNSACVTTLCQPIFLPIVLRGHH